MRVRQQDIARLAKVSQATVSRVLAGDEKVDQKISERVRAVMRAHNYQPDVRARSLRSKRTGLIGLVIKRPHGGLSSDPFFANLIAEIMDFLDGEPFHLCLDIASDEESQVAIYDEMLRTRRVDGLILVESEARDERIQRLQDDAFPFVLIGNPWDKDRIWSVDNDNALASEMATQHLIDQGYRQIGMIAGPKAITVSEDRVLGYQKAVLKAGQKSQVWNSNFGSTAARETTHEALKSDLAPDALVVLDDYMAMGVVRAARESGKRIPQDLGVVSFNDSHLCELIENGLSSVNLSIAAIVRIACEQLIEAINGRDDEFPKRQIVPAQLVA
ncbi:MAG: LacI family DNA-binding transcriptional regulator, partial [Chlorobia bacterium]|nr:LacI family DNA-binding transcriptional regulator [Fimbriimonadaceae bacterium]